MINGMNDFRMRLNLADGLFSFYDEYTNSQQSGECLVRITNKWMELVISEPAFSCWTTIYGKYWEQT